MDTSRRKMHRENSALRLQMLRELVQGPRTLAELAKATGQSPKKSMTLIQTMMNVFDVRVVPPANKTPGSRTIYGLTGAGLRELNAAAKPQHQPAAET